ncbi:hypothetical protein ACOMHN_036046 [Nucella lapillus]
MGDGPASSYGSQLKAARRVQYLRYNQRLREDPQRLQRFREHKRLYKRQWRARQKTGTDVTGYILAQVSHIPLNTEQILTVTHMAQERERARRREYNKRYYLKVQQDPHRYSRLRQKTRVNSQRWRERQKDQHFL